MGLDMYLNERIYFGGNFRGTMPNGSIKNSVGRHNANEISEVIKPAVYWRKANAIHKWFVDNIQDGIDECDLYRVPYSKLMILKELCDEVLKNRDEAEELLPTFSGFFFGSTDYDEYYFEELERTSEELAKLSKDSSYEYSSCW